MIRWIKTRGYTDRIYVVNLILAWIYTFVCVILTVLGAYIPIGDYSFAVIVCPIIWAEVGVHTGFIIWKAKVENLSKWAGEDVTRHANMNINMDI